MDCPLLFMRFASILITALTLVAAACASASGVQIYQRGPIRILYRTSGPDAVALEDRNQNGIPDQVEDAMTQIEAARLLYCQVLKYPDPFHTKRYEGVSFLEIRFQRKETLQGNGKAYDEMRPSTNPSDPAGTKVLHVGLATSVHPKSNPTPAHEFFHVIQNGSIYFKNRWYTEGTARWSQRPFGPDGGLTRESNPWPLTSEQQARIVEMAYDAAATFWKPLATAFDSEGTIPSGPQTEQLAALTYVNGEKVWKNASLPGWKFMRAALEELDAADDVAFRELHYKTWSEENQRSPLNNSYLFGAIEKAVANMRPKE